jgi:putative sigma-54 modulation protein
MNVSYKGLRQELPPKIRSKLDAKFAKLSRLLERRGEKEAHVVVREERHLKQAEITIQFYDHKLVGEGSEPDLFSALTAALAKLEAQAVKQRGKWRERRRRDAPAFSEGAPGGRPGPSASKPRVFRVAHEPRKPITLEEAMLLLDNHRDYLVYRDATSERLAVLVRRRDGHFDLIES